jgi:hypothetical protein
MQRLIGFKRWSLGAAAWLALSLAVPSWSSSIVGGKPIDIDRVPWQLWTGGCGSSWIGKNWVVTAHHCIKDFMSMPTAVGFCAGITNLSECTPANQVRAKKFHIAPGQDAGSFKQDVALVELQADITAVKARPIRLITRAQAAAGLENPGTAAYTSGWGLTSPDGNGPSPQLRGLDVKIGDATLDNFLPVSAAPGSGPCTGDSGGPLVVKDGNGDPVLVGAASYKTGTCGDANTVTLYGRISAHLDWIHATVGPLAVGVDPAHVIAPKIELVFEGGKLAFRASAAGEALVSVHDLSGKTLFRKREAYPAGRHAVDWNPAAGTYLVEVEGRGFRRAERIRTVETSF